MRLRDRYSLFLWAALALVPLMLSSDSIWVDEAQTWRHARHAMFPGWWAEIASDNFSELQVLLGMFSSWVGAWFLGTSEWAMRVPNMLWAAGSIFIFCLLGLIAGLCGFITNGGGEDSGCPLVFLFSVLGLCSPIRKGDAWHFAQVYQARLEARRSEILCGG